MKEPLNMKRLASYIAGMALLAAGLTLTAMTGLGTSPLTAVAFVIAQWTGAKFADMVLVMFSVFVLGEIALEKQKTARNILLLLLQIPLSVAFTRFMGLIQRAFDLSGASLFLRVLLLLLAIVLTGVGAAMTLRAKLIPNPGDGIVKALATFTNKPLGRVKNIFDIANVAAAALLSFACLGRLAGVGAGSVLAMLGVGRVIALFNRLFPVRRKDESKL
ncbi:MAG: hypothetical protein IJ214_07330 [Clostridia bacterium]|nr:hypothetical protein [Clostridia bacterium]